MSFLFMAGAETKGDLLQLVLYAQTLDGLEEIQLLDPEEHTIALVFETEEQAQAAQWILETMGSEGRDGL